MNDVERLEKENEQLRKQLKSSTDQSRVYLQNVAHQLTAPLGAIKWSIEALKDPTIPIGRKGNLLSFFCVFTGRNSCSPSEELCVDVEP